MDLIREIVCSSRRHDNYVPRAPDTIITLSVPSHGRVNGMVTFIGQNGSASNEMTLSGTTRFGTASITTSTGHTLSMIYSDGGFDFGIACDGVFHWAQSHADCMFTFSHN